MLHTLSKNIDDIICAKRQAMGEGMRIRLREVGAHEKTGASMQEV
jgi:hypothetical protein